MVLLLFLSINLSENQGSVQWKKTGEYWLLYILLHTQYIQWQREFPIHSNENSILIVLCFSTKCTMTLESLDCGSAAFPNTVQSHGLPNLSNSSPFGAKSQNSPGSTAHQHILKWVKNPTTHSSQGKESRITVSEIYRENICWGATGENSHPISLIYLSTTGNIPVFFSPTLSLTQESHKPKT